MHVCLLVHANERRMEAQLHTFFRDLLSRQEKRKTNKRGVHTHFNYRYMVLILDVDTRSSLC